MLDLIREEGRIVKIINQFKFMVSIGGFDKEVEVGVSKNHFIDRASLKLDDLVIVEVSPYDLTRGRIHRSSPLLDDSTLIKIFPNPVSTYLNIDSKFISKNMEVLERSSKTIMKINRTNKVDVSMLSAGSYILKITDDENQISMFSFIKE
jgi:translation initiation factor IF-1